MITFSVLLILGILVFIYVYSVEEEVWQNVKIWLLYSALAGTIPILASLAAYRISNTHFDWTTALGTALENGELIIITIGIAFNGIGFASSNKKVRHTWLFIFFTIALIGSSLVSYLKYTDKPGIHEQIINMSLIAFVTIIAIVTWQAIAVERTRIDEIARESYHADLEYQRFRNRRIDDFQTYLSIPNNYSPFQVFLKYQENLLEHSMRYLENIPMPSNQSLLDLERQYENNWWETQFVSMQNNLHTEQDAEILNLMVKVLELEKRRFEKIREILRS